MHPSGIGGLAAGVVVGGVVGAGVGCGASTTGSGAAAGVGSGDAAGAGDGEGDVFGAAVGAGVGSGLSTGEASASGDSTGWVAEASLDGEAVAVTSSTVGVARVVACTFATDDTTRAAGSRGSNAGSAGTTVAVEECTTM